YRPYSIPFWKFAPFIRLLIPLMAGIILQWYLDFGIEIILIALGCFGLSFFLTRFLPVHIQYRLRFLRAVLLHLMIICAGLFITWQKDLQNHKAWYGYHVNEESKLQLQIEEPVAPKNNSYKTTASVKYVINENHIIPVKGKMLLYFSKDSSFAAPAYGDNILINSTLQWIKNSGNPGAFNYKRYAAFQQCYQQVFIKPSDWKKLSLNTGNGFSAFLFRIKSYVVAQLRKYVVGKDEQAIAEALLIGYKEDLDKDLVQAYSNTGVVHIIAISGLHLGMIYLLLLRMLAFIPFLKNKKLFSTIIIIGSLWLFALITGGAASVLRSALMFSFLVIGKNYFRNASIYNSLAASAFLLLIYNPYFLWDVGFQLSYLAVTGIVALQKPLFRLWYIRNKWLRKIWELLSLAIAAQAATFPLCIYHFHQFPNLFFISNLFAVPAAMLLVYGELLLVVIGAIRPLALALGLLISKIIFALNFFIRYIDELPFSVWDNIHATLWSTWVLYLAVFCAALWMVEKHKIMLRLSMVFMILFFSLQAVWAWKVMNQKKIIVYEVPKYTAIDFVYRNKYFFIGDSILKKDGLLRNFHLKPSRIQQQATNVFYDSTFIRQQSFLWQFLNKKLLLIDSAVSFETIYPKIKVDILLISHNPKTYIKNLISAIEPSIIVFDASNSLWKIENWKKECEQLALPFHSVPEKGAFVLDIN
ncbi:MAG: ComEC/Rec2 family competence protein, partial [Ferruginibacter sp.]